MNVSTWIKDNVLYSDCLKIKSKEGFTCKWRPNEEKRFSSRFFFLQSAHLQTRGLQQQPLHVGRTAKSIYFASVLGDSGGDHNRDDDDDMVVLKKITVEQYSVNNLCHCHYMIFNCSGQFIR